MRLSKPAYGVFAAIVVVLGLTESANAEIRLFPVEQQVIAATNVERMQRGMALLAVDPDLIQSARNHAHWMTRNRNLSHTSAAVAENIAMGQNSAREALNSWMNSSGHRANILNPSHRRIGVAAYSTPEGTVYWCQQFLR